MQQQSLESALNSALKQRQAQSTQVKEAVPEVPKESNFLLAALQHSATGMDKIVQRRIGLEQEPVFSFD
jgi:hypothetical protein